HHLETGDLPVRMVGEEQRIDIRVEAQRRQVRLANAFQDQIEVRPDSLDQMEIDQHEQDVVVAGGQVSAGRQCLQEGPAEVFRDQVVAAIELGKAQQQGQGGDYQWQPPQA